MVPLAVITAALLESPVVTPFSPEEALARSHKPAEFQKSRADVTAERASSETGDQEHSAFGSGGMFDKIAFAYDIGNRFMSFGLDQFWRRTMINDCMQLKGDDSVLDLATGTADVALLMGARLAELGAAKAEREDGKPSVFGVDPSREMLRHGTQKVWNSGLQGVVHLHYGDAQNLSQVESVMSKEEKAMGLKEVTTSSIDKVSMAFGIRNVPDRFLALQEIARVLRKKPESRACILEFSLPDGSSTLSRIAQLFIQRVIPFIGYVATLGRGGAEYRYLERSIVEFPAPKDFAAQMTSNGLRVQSITAFAFGSVQLYTADVASAAARQG